MNQCICCHSQLIRYLSHQRVYWFCASCYQEMPNINEIKAYSGKMIYRKLAESSKSH
jgi:hypothetical protein